MSAIKLFTNCPNKRKKELAIKIFNKAKLYKVNISDTSMVYQHLPKEYQRKIDSKINEEFKFEIKKAEDSDGYFYVLSYSPDGIQEYKHSKK